MCAWWGDECVGPWLCVGETGGEPRCVFLRMPVGQNIHQLQSFLARRDTERTGASFHKKIIARNSSAHPWGAGQLTPAEYVLLGWSRSPLLCFWCLGGSPRIVGFRCLSMLERRSPLCHCCSGIRGWVDGARWDDLEAGGAGSLWMIGRAGCVEGDWLRNAPRTLPWIVPKVPLPARQ